MALDGSAEAEGADAAHGVPRNYERGDRRGAAEHARDRPGPGEGARDAAHHRPFVWLRSEPAAVEEDGAGVERGAGAEHRREITIRPGAGPDSFPRGRVLGHEGCVRQGFWRNRGDRTDAGGRQAVGAGARLRPGHRSAERQGRSAALEEAAGPGVT